MSECPACHTVSPAGAKFCIECGTRLATVATAAAPADPRSYTPRHLTDQILRSRAALQGERKRVTVLFADIQGSTRIAEAAGAENWHAILEGFFELLGHAVHRYEGTINQYTGDGIMALFGAPIAHEDHARRAGLAALAMQQQMRVYAEEVRARFGVALGLRVGLNSGEVVVGRIGDDLRMDYTAQGLTVNLAQRMESLCAPGRITLTRHTAGQLLNGFSLRDLGAQAIQGVSEPVQVYELEGEAAAPGATSAAAGWAHTRFIGRDRELTALAAALARVRDTGSGELLLLGGGAGLGKSRLCHEFGQRCRAGGVAFARAACLPYARAIPLWPVRRLLREKLGIRETMTPAEGRAVAESALARLNWPNAEALKPRWLELLEAGEESAAARTQGLGLRRPLLDLVAAALLSSPLEQVLLIEDVHACDPATDEFLQRVAREVRGSRTLLLLNFRPEYAALHLAPLASARLDLTEFAGDDLQQLAADWLGAHDSVQDVTRHVQERTGGNPFFLEEAVRDLEQAGYLRGRRGAYELARPIGQWQIPDTVHALLAARIDRLPPAQKELLQSAAVVGRRFVLALLAEMAGAPLYQVVDGVRALEAAGFLRRVKDGRDEFTLSHALMQEVAYQTLLESQRKVLHARLAECLELRHPQSGAPCEQWVAIAHHWHKAGQWLRAGSWNLYAIQWASRWDLNLMLEQVRAAVGNLDRAGAQPDTVERRIAARSTLIRLAAHTAVPTEEIERAWLEGRELARESRDVQGHAQLVLAYGVHCLHRGDADAAAERAVQAARLVVAGGRPGAAASFVEPVLYVHNTAGRLEEGLALAREMARADWTRVPMDDRNYLARAQAAATLAWLGRLDEARAELEMALTFAADDDGTTTWVHAFLVDLAVLSGDNAQAMLHARYALSRAEAFGSAQYKAWALRAMGAAHCLLGEHAQAAAPLERARGLFADGTAGGIFQGVYLATLAEAYRGSGQARLAAEAAETAIAVARRARARIQELQAWAVFLSLPREGHWVSRVPFGLARMEELIAFTGAVAFMPWWCQCQARWAPDDKSRMQWRRQAVDAFAEAGADAHVKRLAQTA